jgi:hypothetical protein
VIRAFRTHRADAPGDRSLAKPRTAKRFTGDASRIRLPGREPPAAAPLGTPAETAAAEVGLGRRFAG